MPVPADKRRNPRKRWASYDDDALLDLRFCELRLSLQSTPLSDDVRELHDSLARRGILFKPHAWLSTEWFSPDGIPGIAIPFYLAHPRLRRLEQRLMGYAEGGNYSWRRMLLRHEAGHALDTAFGLRRLATWRSVFGKASKKYPRSYSARPASRRFVCHLDHWYSQSHPTEDFAETFAVWMQPKAGWRQRYADWPALEKLDYIDALMAAVASRKPHKHDRSIVHSISENSRTLRSHYKRRSVVIEPTERRYDQWYQAAFDSSGRGAEKAATTLLTNLHSDIRRRLSKQNIDSYLVDQVLASAIKRVRELRLRTRLNGRVAERTATELVSSIATDLLRRNRERFIL